MRWQRCVRRRGDVDPEGARLFDANLRRLACVGITDCFGREIKKARGQAPRLSRCYLFFFAVLRRALPVFFAVDFFAAAVLRFAGFFLFAAAILVPPSGWLAVNKSL